MIIAQILLTVDFMSRKGIIHRDLKPENILINVNHEGGDGRQSYAAKIADFGLSAEIKYGIYSGQN